MNAYTTFAQVYDLFIAIFGGKWKSRIICVLVANERLRYSQIRKEMYNITDAVLAATLRDLIEDGENEMVQCQKCDYHR